MPVPRIATRSTRATRRLIVTALLGSFRAAAQVGALAAATAVFAACGGETTGPQLTPSAIRAEAGAGQTGTAGMALSTGLTVIVTDQSGRPVPGARVEWDAGAGAGMLAPQVSTTDSRGRASTTWTLGMVAGSARVTAQVSGVSPLVFTATVLPGAAAMVVATPDVVFLGLGETVRIRASARDQFGNDLSGAPLAFTSLDPGVATVTNDGVVSTVSLGVARIVASASGRADTVAVTVQAAGASACGTVMPRTMALGEVFLPPAGASSVSACIRAPADLDAEYALTLISTAPSYATVTSLDVYGTGNTGPATAALTASSRTGEAAALTAIDLPPVRRQDPAYQVELARRETERRELAPLTAIARDWQAARASTPSLRAVAEAKVGDLIRLNANGVQGCTSADNRTGRVAAVGTRAIIVSDTSNPSGGYSDAEYASIAATFDTLVYPLDTEAFGTPTNISTYGKIILFYTRSVNALTPPNASYTVGGFFFSRDLYPRAARTGLPGCESSNEQEMLYLLVPDPNGTVNANRRTKTEITLLNLGTIAHELQHLINSSRRLYVTPNAARSEEGWLDEGLSHIAEELLYFRVSGFSSRQNLRLQDVTQQPTNFTNYISQNFSRFYSYLVNPEVSSPYAPNDSLSTRGAIWTFLRYVAGRQGEGGEAAFFRSLVNSPTTGFANLNNATGGQIGDYLRDWTVSNIADDFSIATTVALDPIYRTQAWNFRSIFPGLRFSGGAALGVYPINARSLVSEAPQRITLAGGTSSYVRFGIRADRTARLSLASNGAAPPATLRYAIVRLR